MLKKEKLTYVMRTIAFALLILSAVNILVAIETDTRNITEGERFELKCSTNLQYPVVWHFRQGDGTHEIFFGNKVSMRFSNMFFSTGNQSIGEYNLLIPSVDGRYVGNYKCIDDEGMGAELVSIQININVLISTTHIAPIALHSTDAANCEALHEAASSYQNNMQSSSIAIPLAVCGIVLSMVFVVIVAVQKWRSKRERNRNENCPEARPSSNTDSIETSKRAQTSSDSSDSSTTCEKLDVFPKPSLMKMQGESDAEKCYNSNVPQPASYQSAPRSRIGSNSSTVPLLTDSGERTPEI